MVNEFDSLEEDDGLFNTPAKAAATNSAVSKGGSGNVYNWQEAPDGVKAPPRVVLNDQIVVIKKSEIILPPESQKWDLTRDKTKDVKYCKFILYYDVNGQQEFFSGVRVFKKEDGKYSHPTITKDRKNQASALMGLYADYKKKDINEISLKEFMNFLNSQPKCKINTKEFENPETAEKVLKNIPSEFLV